MIELTKQDILAVYERRAFRNNKWKPVKYLLILGVCIFGTLVIDVYYALVYATPLMIGCIVALIMYIKMLKVELDQCRRLADIAYQNASLRWSDDQRES